MQLASSYALVIASLLGRSLAATNLVQDPQFTGTGQDISPWTEWRSGGYSPGVSSDGTPHVYCFAGDVGCDWIAQDLSSSLSAVSDGSTLNLSYYAYCRSQDNTTADPCYTVVAFAGETWNDTHPYFTSDASAGQWPVFSHTVTYEGTGDELNFTTTIVGSEAMWYATNFSVAVVGAGSGAGTSSSGSSASAVGATSTQSSGGSSSTSGTSTGGGTAGKGKSSSNTTAIAVGCTLGVCVLLLGAVVLYFWTKKRSASMKDRPSSADMHLRDEKTDAWVNGHPSNPSSTPSPVHGWTIVPTSSFAQNAGGAAVQQQPQVGQNPWAYGGHPELQPVSPNPEGPFPSPTWGSSGSGSGSASSASRPDVYSPYRPGA